jgi:long-chain acyl-CoA synthetase
MLVNALVLGELHILDESFEPVPPGTPGTLWFKPGSPFRYFDDVEKTAESTSPDGSMVTVGDVGYLDDDGYLYLTDRATFMIISGGVNIYPQECENLLITHPKVADAAVFGVPDEDLGEEVKAVVQLMPGFDPGPGTAAELIAFCREHLAHLKCPRSVDFTSQLPGSRPASSTKSPSATATGANPAAASCDSPPAPCQDSCCHQRAQPSVSFLPRRGCERAPQTETGPVPRTNNTKYDENCAR